MRFDDDEQNILEEQCNICGRIGGHDPDCPLLNYDDFDDIEDEFLD